MGNLVKAPDVQNILDIQTALIDADTHRIKPLFVHLFADQEETLRLFDWQNIGSWTRQYFAFLLNSGITFELEEVVKV